MATTHRKPRKSKRQPEVGRLFSRVYKMIAKRRLVSNSSRGKKDRFIKATPKTVQKRDKYGRFAKVNRFGLINRQPPPPRDKNGRFISRAAHRPVYRDKRGRFAKPSLPRYRRRVAMALPIVLGIAGVVYFGLQLNKPIVVEAPVAASQVQSAEPEEPDISKVTVVLPRSEPTRLRIPKIAVDTTFTSLGKKADDTIEIPSRPDVVGWYTKAPTPGELGPAIVVGHVDRPGGPAIFWRLRELVPGDTFEIDRADGSTVAFKVDEVKVFPQTDFPTEAVYGNIDYAGIRLITCSGTFNRQIRRYSDNLVVYGSLVVEDKTVSYKTP